jgi:murein endopeptidase
MNPAFVIRNWGDAEPKLTIDGKPVPRGAKFRYGFVSHLEGNDLIVWLAMESSTPTKVEFTAAR